MRIGRGKNSGKKVRKSDYQKVLTGKPACSNRVDQ